MAAYIVFMRDRMRDTKEFATYMEAVPPTLAGHPVKPLALYGQLETLEGPPIEGAVSEMKGFGATVRLPEGSGKYRIFVYAFDAAGNSATANVAVS